MWEQKQGICEPKGFSPPNNIAGNLDSDSPSSNLLYLLLLELAVSQVKKIWEEQG